jgi:hypothetical protein
MDGLTETRIIIEDREKLQINRDASFYNYINTAIVKCSKTRRNIMIFRTGSHRFIIVQHHTTLKRSGAGEL